MMYDRNGFIRNMESGENETGIVRAGKTWDEAELVREFEENRRKVRSTHPYIYANENVTDEPLTDVRPMTREEATEANLPGKVFHVEPAQFDQLMAVFGDIKAQVQAGAKAETWTVPADEPASGADTMHMTPNNPRHAFICCTDNAVICRICGSHRENHAAGSVNSTWPSAFKGEAMDREAELKRREAIVEEAVEIQLQAMRRAILERPETQAEKCGRGEHEEDAGIDTGLLVEYSNTANARVEVCQHCRVLYVAK